MKTYFIETPIAFDVNDLPSQSLVKDSLGKEEAITAFLNTRFYGDHLCFVSVSAAMSHSESVLRLRLFLNYLCRYLGDGFYRSGSDLYFFETKVTEYRIQTVSDQVVLYIELTRPVKEKELVIYAEDQVIPVHQLAISAMQDYAEELSSI